MQVLFSCIQLASLKQMSFRRKLKYSHCSLRFFKVKCFWDTLFIRLTGLALLSLMIFLSTHRLKKCRLLISTLILPNFNQCLTLPNSCFISFLSCSLIKSDFVSYFVGVTFFETLKLKGKSQKSSNMVI